MHTELYQRLVENLTNAVLMVNRSLEVRYLNPAAETLFAVSARQVIGRSIQELLPRATTLSTMLQRAIDTTQPFAEHEVCLTLASGATVTVDWQITPLLDDSGENAALVEIQHIDAHLRITREENILAQYQATRAVTRGLAHEIKNPLGGLRGAAQLLQRELSDQGLREYTAIIISEADRLQNLVNRILGPNSLPQKRWINIHEVLERVRGLIEAEAPKGLQIRCDYDPSIPDVNADPDQLIQAVLNIVKNAAEALVDTDDAQITLRTRTQRQFTIGAKRHRLGARIDVIDNGPGVPADLAEQIFYPMVTGRATGSGLGLSIAQSLVSQHHGLIEFSSTPGETVFTMLLPLESEYDT